MTESADRDAARIQPDGLRYKTKPSGTAFRSGAMGSSLSCLLCGQHKPPAEGAFRKMFNARQFVCFACRPPQPAASTI